VPSPDDARKVFSGTMLGLSVERWGDKDVEVVERADSVAIVAVDRDDRLTLVRQFRAPTRGRLLELPAGTVDEGEEPEATARRELEEETGLRGGEWRPGPTFWTTPGFCAEKIHLFFAERLEPGESRPQGGESIELVRWPAGEVASRLGDIEDGKTLAGLLLYLRERG
jgi:ADP-ribose pyrophosphatase